MRLLPPLVVLAVLALVAVRCAQEPHRAEAQARISGLVQGVEFERARAALERYEARYDEPEDRWFAAGAWFRLGDPVRAIDTIWKHPGLAADAATARRFAEMALFTVGWETEDRNDATGAEPYVLLALVEGGNTWAEERLRRYGTELELASATTYFFPAYRHASTRPLEVLVRAFRDRPDEKFRVGAALGALFGEDYPEREADIALLREVVVSDAWRKQFRPVWLVSALALGRSEDPQALETLQAAAARFEGSPSKRDQEDLQFVRIGLLAAGRFEVDVPLAEAVFGEDESATRTIWYLEALIHRYRSGDMRSELRLRQIWEGPGVTYPSLRMRAARAFLLQDEPPSPDALEKFVGRMVRELEAPEGALLGHVIGRAWRLRAGEDGAREGLLQILRQAADGYARGEPGSAQTAAPLVEALRALYLYG